ncbi:hypothetical protein [Bailinhaonella thermotolerans]|nr:hypothetical protein [Bailinhaonella thermotolerans]
MTMDGGGQPGKNGTAHTAARKSARPGGRSAASVSAAGDDGAFPPRGLVS